MKIIRHIMQIRTSKEPGEGAGACQMDLICAPQLMSAKAGWPVQNGGDARLGSGEG
jgi:hypothetical protein